MAEGAGLTTTRRTATGRPHLRTADAVLWGTIATSLPALAWALLAVARGAPWGTLLPIAALGVAGELLRVRIYRARAETFSFSLAVAATAAAVTAAPATAPLVALASAAVHVAMAGTRRPDKVLFNLAVSVLSAGVATAVYVALLAAGADGMAARLVAATCAVGAYSVVNVGLVSAIISAHSERSLFAVARDTGWYWPTSVLVGLTGAFLGATHGGLGVLGTAMFVLPVFVMRFTLAFYASRSEETIRTLEDQADRLEHLALYDSLTGLPNRRLLQERLDAALAGDGARIALLLLDVDRFKEINDTFGHASGDRLLLEIGPRLRMALRPEDVVARLGGDEFAVLLPDMDVEEAEAVARRLSLAIEHPFVAEGYSLEVSASIGVTVAPEHGGDASALLRRAEIAMYVAKRPGQAYAVYAPEHEARHSPERLALIGELRQAIEPADAAAATANGALVLHYQPKVDCGSGRVVGAEALVRWMHPLRGLVPPDDFIPLAEQTGLIRPLTRRVLALAIEQCSAWRVQGLAVTLAVNLSMRDLEDPALPELIAALLRDAGLGHDALTVEITESGIMLDRVLVTGALSRLRAMGVGVAIDDFGTGYSALSYLKDLPVDALKIDRSFVQPIAGDRRSAAIVATAVTLGHALGLEVVAEGVEDEASLELLRSLGCDTAQGYHLGRPLPADGFAAWVRERRAGGGPALRAVA